MCSSFLKITWNGMTFNKAAQQIFICSMPAIEILEKLWNMFWVIIKHIRTKASTSFRCLSLAFLLLTLIIYTLLLGTFLKNTFYSAGNYMFEVNNRNTRTWCEICSKLTIKTPERCQWRRSDWRRSGVFSVNFEHISYLVLVFL